MTGILLDAAQLGLVAALVVTAWPFLVDLCDQLDDLEKTVIESRVQRAKRGK